MDPIRFAIENPVKISVGVLLVVLFGLISLGLIPVQLTPTVEDTVISVTTRWQGANPDDIQNEVIREQEDRLKSTAGLRKMTSTSSVGEGQLILEFFLGVDKDVALREVSDKLREVPDYPENVDEPVIEASDPQNRDYIAWVILSSSDPDFDVRELQDFAEDEMKPLMERVPGVSEINVLGGYEREAQIFVDPVKLAQRGISPTALMEGLRRRNINVAAGDLVDGKYNVRLRTVGRYDELWQVEDTVLSQPGEPVVRVKDVATIEMGFKESRISARNRGRGIIAINAQREVGSNVIEVMDGLKEQIAYINDVLLPMKADQLDIKGDLVFEQAFDQTVYIWQSLNLVQSNLFIGGAIAVLVLLAFLRSFKLTIIVALAIPISVIGTFLVMVLMGRSVNVISLAGLAFAVGMVVDNAIVVLENIDRHRRGLGEGARTAPYLGAKEVWGAILASTLTTLAVFLPILTIQEEAGQLFRDISLAICAAVAFSLIVSILVIPTAASRLIKEKDIAEHTGIRKSFDNLFGIATVSAKFSNGIANSIHKLSGSYIARILIIVGFVSVAVVGSYLLMPPTTYLPPGNRNLILALMFGPPGYNTAQQESIGKRIETHVRPYWEAAGQDIPREDLPPINYMNRMTGEMETVVPPPISNFFFVSTPDVMFMGGISEDDTVVQPIIPLFSNAIEEIPDIFGFAIQLTLFGGGESSALEIDILGNNYDEVRTVADAMFGRLMGKYGPGTVQPDPANFNLAAPQVEVRLIEEEAYKMGISKTDLGTAVQMAGDGAIVGDFLNRDETIDLTVFGYKQEPGDARWMSSMPISGRDGQIAPLDTISRVEWRTAPQQIKRIESQQAISLKINIPAGIPLEQAIKEINQEIIDPMRAEGTIPPSVRTSLTGTAAKLQEVREALLGSWHGWTLKSLTSLATSRAFLALLIVFLLMAALFENWWYPFVIMFSVPLATVGGFLGLAIVHYFVPSQQLDVLTMLGFVILIGIVVNNAILIVHQALNFMRGEAESQATEEGEHHGLAPREAIAESVRTRVRPIFMSTLTSIGGMLPLVLFPGSGSELYRGLGSVVVGGLLVSAVFTLVLTPLVMSLVFDLRRVVFGRTDH